MQKSSKSFSLLVAMGAALMPVWGGGFSEANATNAIAHQQQDGVCKGNVVDATGEPVIGAVIRVKGTQTAIATDLDGNFSLKGVKKGATLEISSIGMTTKTVVWNGTPINVTLEDDSQTIGEVVVTGYGGVQKAKTMTASAAVVNMGTLQKLPVTTMAEGLGGRVAGVFTQQSSGAPGEKTKVWVRGGSNILYVIDDVVLDTSQGEDFFSRLRPDDIANMSVLKDAAATAVYGPRAANGVVVIQTKRGTEGAPEITFNQKFTVMTPSYRAKAMNAYDYVNTMNELYLASYAETPYANTTELSKFYMGYLNQKGYSREEIRNMVNEKYGMNWSQDYVNELFDPYKTEKNITDYYQTYDSWDQFEHTQPMFQTNLSLRGGSERIKYYSSVGYMDQQGLSDTYGYKQYNIVLNTDAFLLKDKSLKFTFNLNGNIGQQNKPGEGDMVFRNVMYQSGNTPTNPAQWSTGNARKNSADSRLNTGFQNTDTKRFQMNAALKWNLPWVPGLSAQASVNYTTSHQMQKNFNHDQENVYDTPYSTTFSTYNPENASLYQYWYDYKLTTGIFQVDYSKSIGKHNFSVMANYQSQIRHENWSDQTKKGFATTLAPQEDIGATMVSSGGSASDWGSASWIGRFTYDYANKYMFQYSMNYNGSLSYSPDKRWGLFHAFSVGWNMAEESWFKKFVPRSLVSEFKLRGGFGLVGNEVGSPFSYLTQYSQNGNRVLFGNGMTSNVGWYINSVASDLQWSSSKQMGLGLDFSMFKGRLNGAIDTYLYLNKGDVMNMTDEMLRTDILGMPNIPKINAPFVTNKKGGIEVSLNWQDKIGDFGYKLGVTYSHWDQITTRHTDKLEDWYFDAWDTVGKRTEASNALYYAGLMTNGLYTSWNDVYNSFRNRTRGFAPGTVKLVDLNGDGYTDDYHLTNAPGSTPLTQYGVTLGGSYKGFEVELFFQGATDVTGAMTSPFRSQQGYMWNYGQYGFNNAYLPSKNNVDAAIPLPTTDGRGWGYSFIDMWQFDASYLKLKNISLRYDMKREVLKNVDFIKGLDLSFVVTNAFTWTKSSYPYKNLQDPEFITTNAGYYEANGGLGSYPTQRTYTFNVVLTL